MSLTTSVRARLSSASLSIRVASIGLSTSCAGMAVEDGVASLAYDPRIHEDSLRNKSYD
jgi:hypothetical protein